MEPGIDAQAGNVSGEPPSRAFDVVLRGYDRHRVDEHIEQLRDQGRRYRSQAQALRRELSAAHRQLQERGHPAYAGLGLRIEPLLRLAEEQATEILGEARAAADELRAAAEAAAAELVQPARHPEGLLSRSDDPLPAHAAA
jgi:cell division septum initiation protein DivIVA